MLKNSNTLQQRLLTILHEVLTASKIFNKTVQIFH